MSEQERDLLRSVLVDPADDLPRLVYADWFDENGQPERAEFIRCQIEHSSIPIHECDCIYPGCAVYGKYVDHDHKCRGYKPQQRYIELFNKYGDKWFGKNSFNMDVFRGWPSEIHCTLAEFMAVECQRCNGAGQTRFYHPSVIELVEDCQECNDGRIEGLAKRIGETWPVTAIVITNGYESIHDLHDRVWYFDHKHAVTHMQVVMTGGDTNSLNSIFSKTAVNYMRSLANLPPLYKVTI